MAAEIRILLQAAKKDCAVVEKNSNVRWSREDLEDAAAAALFGEEDVLAAPPAEPVAVTSVYPGCMQQSAAAAELSRCDLVGQTRHFLIFVPEPQTAR